MQAHTFGEVGNLGTVLLRVYSGTVFPIFIEIGVLFERQGAKYKLAQFFETRCSFLKYKICANIRGGKGNKGKGKRTV